MIMMARLSSASGKRGECELDARRRRAGLHHLSGGRGTVGHTARSHHHGILNNQPTAWCCIYQLVAQGVIM